MQFLYKDYKIQGNTYQTKTHANKDISFYYKIKLFRNADRIISIQPKILYRQDNQQLSYELSLLFGKSRKLSSNSIFFENSFTIGKNLKAVYEGKNYYSSSSTLGVKFKNGIIVASFIHYHLRKNHNFIYNKTLYYQF